MSPAADAVVRRLDAARQKWWFFTLVTTTAIAACLSFGTLLLLMVADALVKFSQIVLLGMTLTWLAMTVGLIVMVGRRLLRSQRSLEATARRVESAYPELGSNLINLVQLSEDVRNADRAFCDTAVKQAAARIGQLRFDGAAAGQSRWRRFIYCMQTPRDLAESLIALGLLIAIAVLCQLLVTNFGSAADRLLSPWEFVPSVGRVEIVEVNPGHTEVLLGDSLQITAEINNPKPEPHQATLLITPEDEQETALLMTAGKRYWVEVEEDGVKRRQHRRRYQVTLSSITKPLTYRLEIGDSQSEIYTVGVREKPTVEEVEVTFHYPAYLNRDAETFKQKHADLEAPQYTVAELRIRPSVPICEDPAKAKCRSYIRSGESKSYGRVENNGELLVIKQMPLVKDTTFTVHLFNDAGHTDPNPRVNRVHVLPDSPPKVQLVKPGRQSSAAPGDHVPVTIRAGDDHGLGLLRLEMKIRSPESEAARADGERPEPAEVEPPTIVKQWTEFDDDTADDTAVEEHHRLELNPQQVKPGQTVLIRAVARDKRSIRDRGLEPQETPDNEHQGWHSIHIVAKEAKSGTVLEQLDGLRASIWKILEKQIRARVRAAMILKTGQPAEGAAVAGDIRSKQVEVQKMSIGLVKSIGRTGRKERLTVKGVLNKLAFGEMLQAVQQCDALMKAKAVEQFDAAVPELTATQDRIIDVLRKLLGVTRRAQSELLSEMKKRPGGDLPDDVQQTLEDLNNKLEKALKQQRKVVEAAENLAKAPVEDFADQKQQLLEALAAAEDDWSRFMTELNTDLSKLPEQDFANPSLLEELVEIQTEIKMAEDALLKKTADIAVPLEQLGYEMAEQLKTNLEKWLPDTPDRERWSQEESLTDQDKEAPMAELPGELEDLIGELMEEEEDLFDEMEDVSSSAADSLDKGAGWDVADGPISNMSAKGATGNRLPNTSEIGGRSGEGRSGKSSGEFVGDEAVGKGGRKTPSRLTPDPYLKGQIKDHSKDPTGGATGGGKESGQGGEGLEGPLPPAKERNLQRLAGKQAALRNKAEGVKLQFQITDFHQTDLKKMVELMLQIERDLKAGRYQNALRQRKVLLDGLGELKQYLEGEFEVRQDTTANLPSDIHKEILGSMEEPSPAGWEKLNREYFERLATGGPAQSEPDSE